MNRIEFMEQLERLLQNVSPAEKEEALQYYNDYFDDAGPESEQDVLEALGNPAKVAESIKREIGGNGSAELSEKPAVPDRNAVVKYEKAKEPEKDVKKEKQDSLPTWAIVLIVILCVIASPAALGLISGAAGIAAGLFTAWFSMIFGFGVAAVALILVLIILGVLGIKCLFGAPFAGMALLGTGMLCGGLGLLFLMLTVAMAGIATPAIFHWIVRLCKSISAKRRTEKS